MTTLSANVSTADKAGTQEEVIKKTREEEWAEVEELVIEYKKQFEDNATREQVTTSKEAAEELLRRFTPFITKYLILLRSGQIDFNDKEMKLFVASFMDDESLKSALKRKRHRQ